MAPKVTYSSKILVLTWAPRMITVVIVFVLALTSYLYFVDRTSRFDVEARDSIKRGFVLMTVWTTGTLILDTTEIVLWKLNTLRPVQLFVSNLIKLGFWTYYLASVIISMLWIRAFNTIFFAALVLFGFTLTSFVYACIVLHRTWRAKRQGKRHGNQPGSRTKDTTESSQC